MENQLLKKIVDSGNKAVVEKKSILLRYQSARNEITDRKFEIQAIDIASKSNNGHLDFILSGYCHLRNSQRSFYLSKIKKVIDLSTGEIFNNIECFINTLSILRFMESSTDFIDSEILYNFYFDEHDEKIYSVYSDLEIEELNILYEVINNWCVIVNNNPPIWIDYTPRDGDTNRKLMISIENINKISSTSFQLTAIDLESNQKVWIPLEDIKHIYDKNNVNIDAGKYFIYLIKKSDYFITQAIIKPYYSQIEVLVYFYRKKGRLTKKDRIQIADYFISLENLINPEIIDEEIKSRKVSKSAFKRAISKLNESSSSLKDLMFFLDSNLSIEDKNKNEIIEAFSILHEPINNRKT